MKNKSNYGLVKERLIIAILATKLVTTVLKLLQEIVVFINVAFNYTNYYRICFQNGGTINFY